MDALGGDAGCPCEYNSLDVHEGWKKCVAFKCTWLSNAQRDDLMTGMLLREQYTSMQNARGQYVEIHVLYYYFH